MHRHDVCFSNRPFGVKHFQTIHHAMSMSLAGSCFSSESALGPFHQFENEVEQSLRRPYREPNDRPKRTCELTSSIVPRGTSFRRWVDLGFPPIALILYAPHAATVSLVHRNSNHTCGVSEKCHKRPLIGIVGTSARRYWVNGSEVTLRQNYRVQSY
jgi:hypothetical protein